MLIDVAKAMHGGRFIGPGRSYGGGKVELMFITAVVLIGHVEGKPRTPTEIARFLGFPRITTRRKLESLEKQGVVERRGTRYLMCRDTQGDRDEHIDAAIKHVKRAAQNFSRE